MTVKLESSKYVLWEKMKDCRVPSVENAWHSA